MKKIRSELPEEIHGKLKSKAALMGLKLKEYIVAILTREAERHESK